MSSPTDSPASTGHIPFVSTFLGPAALRLLHSIGDYSDAEQEDSSWDEIDSVLGLVFKSIQEGHAESEALKKEFFGYIYDLCSERRGLTRDFPVVKPIANTHDLLGEVILGLLASETSLVFLGRNRFCTLIWMRMSWKAHQISRRKRASGTQSELVRSLASEGDCPQESLSKKEGHAQLQVALGRLNPRERDILGFYLEGKPSSEIGQALGMKDSAVRKAIQRVLDRLSTYLKAQ
ncbi:MAG: sigma-70 family RNA polymerase sigma factor [Planctomycetota bacterium]